LEHPDEQSRKPQLQFQKERRRALMAARFEPESQSRAASFAAPGRCTMLVIRH
jgi:hypothetical protein